ncbi:MAG: hypothetical protein KUG80_01335 [Gammaproteobacteria bacterium]|nr:hypothetical protein [Gammaproteobacteria bacterium]
MKAIMKKVALATIAGSLAFSAQAVELDSDSATVSMNVGLYASLTGLDDFSLSTSDADGEAGATYNGDDDFNLESNGQVHVSMSGGNLTNGSDSVATSYSLDSASTAFDTTTGVIHNASHNVSAQAVLGAISAQKAGSYSGSITITVSSI